MMENTFLPLISYYCHIVSQRAIKPALLGVLNATVCHYVLAKHHVLWRLLRHHVLWRLLRHHVLWRLLRQTYAAENPCCCGRWLMPCTQQ